MKKSIILSIILLTLGAVGFWGCSENCDCSGDVDTLYIADYDWQTIEIIVLDADAEVITFDSISDNWNVLNIEACGALTGEENEWLYLRINDDTLENYSWADDWGSNLSQTEISLGLWKNSISTISIYIYQNINNPSYQVLNWISTGYDSIDVVMGYSTRTGSHFGLDSMMLNQIDIYLDSTAGCMISEGSYFILQGFDPD